jgi:hypothetical protein
MDTAMPLQLLQQLDGNNPASTPVHLSGPEQRLIITPDPGVGDESLLPPSQLLIGKDGESRSIWPVHLAGWQALGWQLNAASWEVSSAQRCSRLFIPSPPLLLSYHNGGRWDTTHRNAGSCAGL